ncbi:hypothetical protein ABZ832_19345 [Streptantibioticus parmotrematis]|uniref:hypothetical protein n=1 Tax=Streptantibioticus parmotrematis TaxID=2873249 RepID=UPI003402C759
MSDSPDDSGGFSSTDDGTFGDPTSDPGSIQDYDSWDWKQIMAAINGMSAGTDSSSNESRAQGISDPQSLMDAAGYFLDAQTVLAGIAKSLTDQATALAGDNGPWKGDAADSFLDMMNTFSRQVKATVDVLSGGEAGNSVPQQLADNSVNLYNARTKIADIDSWYADQAVKMGVKPMSNGLIPIHEKPQLVDMMTNDMRAVLKSLAGEYQVTIDSVKNPTPVTNPTGNPDVPDDTPNVPDPDMESPHLQPVDQGTPQQFAAPDTTGMDAPRMDALSPTDGLSPMDALASPTPFGGGTGVGGNAPDMDGLGNDDGLTNDALDPSALDKALNPTPFQGGDGVGGTMPTLTPSAFPGGLGTGDGLSPNEKLADEDPQAWSDDAAPEDFPGDTGVGGTGGLGAPDSLGDEAPEAFPGDLAKESGLPSGLKTPAGLDDALESPGTLGDEEAEGFPGGTGTAGGMPMMPGMGSGGMPTAGATDPSDASGLLDSDAEPWTGDPNVADTIGGKGAQAGGEGLDGLPTDEEAEAFPGETGTNEGQLAGSGGMPMMPGMGSGGMPTAGATDPSDASGLLDSDAEPWTGDPNVADTIGGKGAQAGGEGLDGLPTDEEAEAFPGELGTEEGESASGAGGMPMMPGMGGAGAAGNQSGNEPSDASGLLEPDAEPWTGDPAVSDDMDGGTEAGGEGLGLPSGEEAEAFPEGVMVGSDGLPIAPAAPTASPMPAALTDAEEEPAAPTATAGGAGMPGMMPGTASAGREEERSDASGLLAPDAQPWSPEAEPGGDRPVVGAQDGVGEGELTVALVGAAAGVASVAAWGAGVPEDDAERDEHRRHHDDGAAVVLLPFAEEEDDAPAASGEVYGPADPAGGDPQAAGPVPPVAADAEAEAEADSSEDDDPYQRELPDDQVALTPPGESDAEDTTAWDAAGSSFVPLLWSVPAEDEQEVRAPGYASEDEATWTGGAPVDGEADGPRLSTWRPSRAAPAAPGEPVLSAVPLRSFAGDPSLLAAEPAAQEPVEDEEDGAEEEQPGRGIADLLVQEGDTWGSAASDGSGAVL